jgi:hypothetical protein
VPERPRVERLMRDEGYGTARGRRGIMENRLSRFKYCDSKFYPYLEKVLNRLPIEDKERILNDTSFQIMGGKDFRGNDGTYYPFDEPVTSLVYLNNLILTRPEYDLIHTIAHELAHHVAGKGKTGLYEKEAEELLLKWGFEDESEKVEYGNPIMESEGYKLGYEWALEQKDQHLLDSFEEYYGDWENGALSEERMNLLHYDIDPLSLLEATERIAETIGINGELSGDPAYLDKGIIWGIMGRVKEIILNRESHYSITSKSDAEFFESLEKINSEFDKLFMLRAYGDFFEEMHRYGIPDLSVKVDEFLRTYRDKSEGD